MLYQLIVVNNMKKINFILFLLVGIFVLSGCNDLNNPPIDENPIKEEPKDVIYETDGSQESILDSISEALKEIFE